MQYLEPCVGCGAEFLPLGQLLMLLRAHEECCRCTMALCLSSSSARSERDELMVLLPLPAAPGDGDQPPTGQPAQRARKASCDDPSHPWYQCRVSTQLARKACVYFHGEASSTAR